MQSGAGSDEWDISAITEDLSNSWLQYDNNPQSWTSPSYASLW